MKKISLFAIKLTVFSIFLFPLLSLPIANAATTTVRIFEPTHRQSDGRFIDDDLTASLAANGALGKLIFQASSGSHIWQIDAAVLEEITAMSKGYTLLSGEAPQGVAIAQSWLQQLLVVTANAPVTALPSGYWIHRLAPHDQNYFLVAGQQHLQLLLGRPVLRSANYPENKYFKIDPAITEAFKNASADLQLVAIYLSSTQLEEIKLRSASIFARELDPSRRDFLARNLTSESYDLVHNIRVIPGRFTVTASKQKLPITVVNDFLNSAKVQLRVSSLNSKVVVGEIPPLVLAPKSKTQVLVPIEVLTSGTSALAIDAISMKGDLLGDSVLFPLKLSVINPVATWITTGAGITLFVAAVIQSIRRIRRRRS
jgi:hypothetical protein